MFWVVFEGKGGVRVMGGKKNASPSPEQLTASSQITPLVAIAALEGMYYLPIKSKMGDVRVQEMESSSRYYRTVKAVLVLICTHFLLYFFFSK